MSRSHLVGRNLSYTQNKIPNSGRKSGYFEEFYPKFHDYTPERRRGLGGATISPRDCPNLWWKLKSMIRLRNVPKNRTRNPRYAPEFLERKLCPSGLGAH